MINLTDARKKLLTKTHQQINADSAYSWASLAMVALELAAKSKTQDEALQWLIQSDEYKNESYEHSSLIDDDGVLLRKLSREIKAYHKRMILIHRKTEFQDE